MLWEEACGRVHICGTTEECVGCMWETNKQQCDVVGCQRRCRSDYVNLSLTLLDAKVSESRGRGPRWALPHIDVAI